MGCSHWPTALMGLLLWMFELMPMTSYFHDVTKLTASFGMSGFHLTHPRFPRFVCDTRWLARGETSVSGIFPVVHCSTTSMCCLLGFFLLTLSLREKPALEMIDSV